jgi:hypothetical protein
MTRDELAAKVDYEGGVAEAIAGYGMSLAWLPDDTPDYIRAAWKRVYDIQPDVEVIEEWLSNGDGEEEGADSDLPAVPDGS